MYGPWGPGLLGNGAKAGQAHAVVEQQQQREQQEEEEEPEEEDDDKVIELDISSLAPEKADAVLLAARAAGYKVRQPFQRVQRPQAKARAGPRAGAPRTARETAPAKCANCGGPHGTRACPNPDVPMDQRPCFNCNKKGHRAADCSKPAPCFACG